MKFRRYYESLIDQITDAKTLADLTNRRKRFYIGNQGLKYKVKNGRLQAHSYTGQFKQQPYFN